MTSRLRSSVRHMRCGLIDAFFSPGPARYVRELSRFSAMHGTSYAARSLYMQALPSMTAPCAVRNTRAAPCTIDIAPHSRARPHLRRRYSANAPWQRTRPGAHTAGPGSAHTPCTLRVSRRGVLMERQSSKSPAGWRHSGRDGLLRLWAGGRVPRVPQSSSPRPLSARQEPIARRVTSIGLPTACSPLPVIGRAGVLATEAYRSGTRK